MGETDIYAELGRLAGLVEGLTMRIEELHSDVRQLPCRTGQAAAACVVPRKQGSSDKHPAVTARDLEESQRIVLCRAEEAAERTVEERLASLEQARAQVRAEQQQQVEQRRGSMRFFVDLLKSAGPAIVAIVVALGVRCEMAPQAARPSTIQRVQQPASQPALRR